MLSQGLGLLCGRQGRLLQSPLLHGGRCGQLHASSLSRRSDQAAHWPLTTSSRQRSLPLNSVRTEHDSAAAAGEPGAKASSAAGGSSDSEADVGPSQQQQQEQEQPEAKPSHSPLHYNVETFTLRIVPTAADREAKERAIEA